MVYHARTCFVALCLLTLPALVVAQTPTAKDASTAKITSTKKSSASRDAVDPLIEQRRNTAISLLLSLADEAKSYHDETLRARVLARTADALWESDTEHARALFRRAWDAAEVADADSARHMEEDINKQQKLTGSAAIVLPPNIRNEVVRLVAHHDRALGDEFLKKIAESKERDAAANSLNRGPSSASASQSQRLRLATQLLQDGDVAQALYYADPALDAVNPDSINFLSTLREKNATAADERYLALLARTAADPASDANTISGLSSYAFTPFLYVIFSTDGGASQMAQRRSTPAPDLPAGVRNAFFSTATQVLLRPILPPGQDTTSSGRAGKYLVIKRLLPLFDQYAPDRAAELRVQMTALMADVPEQDRTGENRAITRGIVPEDSNRDPMQNMQQRLDHAATSEERDSIYADVAVALAGSGDARGRDLVDKIDDTELRKQTRAYTDFQYLNNALQKKDIEEATRIARSGELTHTQRVWGLTQAARQIIKSDRSRAVDLLDEALTEARRIGGSDADHPRAIAAVTAAFADIDRSRVWDLLSEVVKAGNSAENFTGDDARLSSGLHYKNGIVVSNINVPDFDLLGTFSALARMNLYPTIEAAKNFTNEVPRANAILAIARTVLEEKRKP
jgi:hypothetical protein